MSDLYVRKELFPIAEDGPSFLKATVPEVVVWLREQGAGEVTTTREWQRVGVNDSLTLVEKSFLVIPLDTEPPKEDGE